MALSKQVMRALDVRPGDYVTFEIDEGGLVRLHKLSLTVVPPRARPGLPRHASADS